MDYVTVASRILVGQKQRPWLELGVATQRLVQQQASVTNGSYVPAHQELVYLTSGCAAFVLRGIALLYYCCIIQFLHFCSMQTDPIYPLIPQPHKPGFKRLFHCLKVFSVA